MVSVSSVQVGRFAVADAKPPDIARAAIDGWISSDSSFVLLALHVAGLLLEEEPGYVEAVRRCDLVYADGASVVLIARVAGARNISRCPTTDFGHHLLLELTDRLDRPPAIALVGGPPGLADRAGQRLIELYGVEVVLTANGYQESWDEVLDGLAERAPEVLLLGLGTELEARWTNDNVAALGHTLVVTCGGWFGFLAGEERRAPAWMRSMQLEWFHRLWLSPARLGPRYGRGFLRVLSLLVRERRQRARVVLKGS